MKIDKDWQKILGVVTLGLITLLIGVDGKYYWHDVRFSYAASKFSMDEILSGVFNPHQLPGPINEISAGGFYLAKVLHIWTLQWVFWAVPPALGGFQLAGWISIICLGFAIWMSYFVFVKIFKSRDQALLSVACLLLLPITPYLAEKLLSEVPAFLIVTLSILALLKARAVEGWQRILMILASGTFLLLAALTRVDIVLSFFGFSIAWISSFRPHAINREKFGVVGAVWLILGIGYSSFVVSSGKEFGDLIAYLQEFTHSGMKSWVMSVLGFLTFGGLVYCLALFSVLDKEKGMVLFFTIWFVLSVGPMMLITVTYMVEPRYLVVGMLPLAGLGGKGLFSLLVRIQSNKRKLAALGGVVFIGLLLNMLTIELMPYELDRAAILDVVNIVQEKDEQAPILIPWAYTDFHFLRLMFPEAPIFNVNTPTRHGQLTWPPEAWQARLRKWYAQSYVSGPDELARILGDKGGFYLGWRQYPPAQYVKNLANLLGLDPIVAMIERLRLKNHLEESWIWHSSDYDLQFIGRRGQYEYYKVDQAKTINLNKSRKLRPMQ